jgi:hypothetical protein
MKCEGAGELPEVQRPGTYTWSSVIHRCAKCGRLWSRNGDNNGWEKLPIPMHYRRIKQVEESNAR